MTDEFETIEMDIPEDQQHRMIDVFVRMNLSAPAVETYVITRETESIEKALYMAVINEVVLITTSPQHNISEQDIPHE